MEKKFFFSGANTENAPLWIFVSYNLPRGDQAGVSLDFDHVCVGEDLYQIWCFIQNLHNGCAYTPHYYASSTFRLKIKEALHINWLMPDLNKQKGHVNITISV